MLFKMYTPSNHLYKLILLRLSKTNPLLLLRKFGNIYIGWGMKYIGEAYTPTIFPPPQNEYPSGPEITEALDPSVEEEQALKAALEEQTAALEETEDLEEDEEEDD